MFLLKATISRQGFLSLRTSELDFLKSLQCQGLTKLSSVSVGVKLFKHDGCLDILLPGHTWFSSELAPFPVALI